MNILRKDARPNATSSRHMHGIHDYQASSEPCFRVYPDTPPVSRNVGRGLDTHNCISSRVNLQKTCRSLNHTVRLHRMKQSQEKDELRHSHQGSSRFLNYCGAVMKI